MTEVTGGFCWHQNFAPWGLSAPHLWLYTFIKSWKDVLKVRGWRVFFIMQQMTKVIRLSCWHQNVDPKGLSAPAQGPYTCIKSWKNVHKIRGQSYFLKHAISDQSDKTFLLSWKKCPCQNLYQVVVCPCPGAFFKWWPWPFLWRGQICFLILLYSLYSIECSCISKFVLIHHILSTQVSNTGPLVLWLSFPWVG